MLVIALLSVASVQAQDNNEDVIFYESFDKMNGKGGNDGNWERNENLSGGISDTDNSGWYVGKIFLNTSVFNANKCVLIGSIANLTTPALTKLSGDATMTFLAGATNNSDVTLKLSIQNGGELDINEIKLEKNQFKKYTVHIKKGTAKTKIKFENTKSFCSFLLDEVKIVKENTPTAISTVKKNTTVSDNKVYNLNGQFVGTSTQGLKQGVYIINNKKVVVK